MKKWRAALIVLSLVGCSSSNPTLYTLVIVPGAALAGPARTITMRSPVLPSYVKRREIVRRDKQSLVNASDDDWWSEPLADMVRRVLVADLAQRLPGSLLLSSDGVAGELATIEIEIELQQFDLDANGRVMLSGFAAISGRGHARRLERLHTMAVSTGTKLPAQVDAASLALGQIADTIAAALRR